MCPTTSHLDRLAARISAIAGPGRTVAVAESLTGADGQDGHELGTVFLAVDDGVTPAVVRRDLAGDPGEVCTGAAEAAPTFLADRLEAVGEIPRRRGPRRAAVSP